MNSIWYIIICCIAGYLLGNLSFARFFCKKEKKEITASGSGNPGTMNMLRTHGILLGIITLIFDALKGAIPALVCYFLLGGNGGELATLGLYLAGFSAVLGHIFPIFYKFKGGKGIATSIGVFFVADPLTAGILFAILLVVLYYVKIGSIFSMFYIFAFALIQTFRLSFDYWSAILVLYLCVVIDAISHRKNFVRLIDDEENETDLKKCIEKDLAKVEKNKEKKLDKVSEKVEKLENKFEKSKEKLTLKQEKITNKYVKKTVKVHKNAPKKLKAKKNLNSTIKKTIKSLE